MNLGYMIFQKTVTCLLSFQVYLQAWETNYSGVPTHLLPGEVSLYIKLNASINCKTDLHNAHE